MSAGSPLDVNGDGAITILDLILVSGEIGTPAAPVAADSVDAATVGGWIAQARLADDGSLVFKQGIENLKALLRSLIPKETALLPNYPNPFNPETWIPYDLAHAADVTLTVYDTQGRDGASVRSGTSACRVLHRSVKGGVLGWLQRER